MRKITIDGLEQLIRLNHLPTWIVQVIENCHEMFRNVETILKDLKSQIFSKHTGNGLPSFLTCMFSRTLCFLVDFGMVMTLF